MDLFEKRRFRKLLVWSMNVDVDNPSTWNYVYPPPMDIKKDTISHAFSSFNINKETQVSNYSFASVNHQCWYTFTDIFFYINAPRPCFFNRFELTASSE